MFFATIMLVNRSCVPVHMLSFGVVTRVKDTYVTRDNTNLRHLCKCKDVRHLPLLCIIYIIVALLNNLCIEFPIDQDRHSVEISTEIYI